MTERATWDETWMSIADSIAKRSRCARRQCGAVIVTPENRVVAVGYNGPPAGWNPAHGHDSCTAFCERAALGIDLTSGYGQCPSVHAESNAITRCGPTDLVNATIYVSGGVSCFDCAKLVSNTGIHRVVLRMGPEDEHRDPMRSINMYHDSGLDVTQWI